MKYFTLGVLGCGLASALKLEEGHEGYSSYSGYSNSQAYYYKGNFRLECVYNGKIIKGDYCFNKTECDNLISLYGKQCNGKIVKYDL